VKVLVKGIGISNKRRKKMSWFKRKPHLKTPPKLHPHNLSPTTEKLLKETVQEVREGSGVKSKMFFHSENNKK
jgi:hypothetical protein